MKGEKTAPSLCITARPDPEPVRVPPGPAAMEHVVFGPDGMLL